MAGLNSFFSFDYGRVVFSFLFYLCLALLFLVAGFNWMRCLRIEHHLAAKF